MSTCILSLFYLHLTDIYKCYHVGMGRSERNSRHQNESQEKKVLIGARVSQGFHRRIQSECVRREMSIQDLIVAGLKLYFASPADWDHADMKFYTDAPNFTKKQVDERNAWMKLWNRYLSRMPQEKVQIMTTAMEWDLQMLKSSRRKSTNRGPASQQQGGKA